MCFWFHKKPKAVQTVKLTFHNRPKSRNAICSCLFIEMNQTAHISLQIFAISKSVETKSTRSASFPLAHPASSTSELSPPPFPQEHRSLRPSGVPLCASAPPVRGYLRIAAEPRNPFFGKTSSFFQKSRFPCFFKWLQARDFKTPALRAILFLRCGGPIGQILSYPQTKPQDSPYTRADSPQIQRVTQ